MVSIFVPRIVFPTVFLSVLLAMVRLVLRHIYVIIPSVFYEIDGAAACIIFGAMLAPLLLVTGRHVHIDWLINDTGGCGLYHDGSCINDFRLGEIPDINSTIKAGLANTDRNTDISCMRGNGHKDDHDGEQKMFHFSVTLPSIHCTLFTLLSEQFYEGPQTIHRFIRNYHTGNQLTL
jgi:hypothetical protein